MASNIISLLGDKQKTTNKVNVYTILKNSIQFLVLKPGTKIVEAELAAELGVSRTPIREALLHLSDELLVEIYPQRGTYVSKINLHLAREMAYMRHILETEICLEMCRKKAKVRDIVEDKLYFMNLAVKKQDVIEYIMCDDEFHGALFSYDKHDMIWKIISNTRSHYNRILVLDMMFPNSLEDSYNDHLKIVECIESGDEDGLIKLLNLHHEFTEVEHIKEKYKEYFA